IASLFCTSHGGSLAISSEFGEGTTVALSIACGGETASGEEILKAKLPNYLTDRFSGLYIELCELCEIPH
ncbi:MAG: hypothetical protein Q4B42_07625, partial [Oscillospiraceae bacterium]|nr:hypothetical protein [Oscillospiraceae bacterium]